MSHFISEPLKDAQSKKAHEIGIMHNNNLVRIELNDKLYVTIMRIWKQKP